MIQLVKKWRILYTFQDGCNPPKQVVFYIHDNHFTNVLRKLTDITFYEEVDRLDIIEYKGEAGDR